MKKLFMPIGLDDFYKENSTVTDDDSNSLKLRTVIVPKAGT